MNIIKYSYEKVPTIRKFAEDYNSRWKAILGPFGSGKSSGCLMELLKIAHLQKPSKKDGIRRSRFAIIRNTYPQLKDTTLKTVLDWLPENIFGTYKVATHDYIITGFQGCYIEFMFRALDQPEHVTNLLSLELTGAWVNEAREVPREIIDALDGRIGRYPSIREGGAVYPCIIMDTNPPDEDSWFYKLFEESKTDNIALYKQPSGLSPQAENLLTLEEWDAVQRGEEVAAGLHPTYYIDLAKNKTPEFINIYIEGNYGTIKAGKPVYDKTFNEQLHIAPSSIMPITGKEVVVGLDFGLTPAAIFTQLSPMGIFNVLRELYEDNMGIEQFMDSFIKPYIASEFKGYSFIFIGDPAGVQRAQTNEKSCFDIIRSMGFKIIPSKSNSFLYRKSAVEYFLTKLTNSKPAFQIDPSCKMLISGFKTKYCYKPLRSFGGNSFSTEVKKNEYSHPHDALQYAASYYYSTFEKNRVSRFNKHGSNYKPASTYAGY